VLGHEPAGQRLPADPPGVDRRSQQRPAGLPTILGAQ
jgi:hypothetical protein